MKKVFVHVILLLMLCFSVVLTGCQQTPEVRLGFIVQLSGPDAYVGQAARLALDDRVKEINENGGIQGRKVKLIIYDSRREVANAVAFAKRLVEKDHVVGIIGPEWSGAAIPIAFYADSARVPVIATAASNVRVTVDKNNQVHPYMFRACFIDSDQGYALADFAYNELGKRSAAFITDSTQVYSVEFQNYFERYFTDMGGEVVSREGYQITTTNFYSQIQSVAASNADVLVIPTATYRDAARIAQQAEAIGENFLYLGVDGWIADELLTTAGSQLDGAYFSTGVSPDQEIFQDYNKRFEEVHGMRPTAYAFYALDALSAFEYAIAQSINKTGQADPIAIRDALEDMQDVPGFTGKITIDPQTHNPRNKPVLILQIKDGKYREAKVYNP